MALPEAPAPALNVDGLSKSFGGNPVLRNVRMAVAPGEIRALLGANGSGKSTLVKLLAGVHRPDRGDAHIAVVGRALALPVTSAGARSAGLRFVHQELGLVDRRPVLENLILGRPFARRFGLIDWGRERRDAQALLDRFHPQFSLDQLVGTLTRAQQAMLAIIRAFAPDPKSPLRVLVLDEPTAGLPIAEVKIVIDTMRRVASHGVGVVFVSHSLDEVEEACDSVTVMRDGEVALDTPLRPGMRNDLIEAITGHHPELYADDSTEHAPAPVGSHDVVLNVRNLRTRSLRGVNLEAHAGEIVGITGDLDSGVGELLPALTGDLPREIDLLEVLGAELTKPTVGAARAAGLAYIPAKRATEGIFPGLSVRENLLIGTRREADSWFHFAPRAARRAAAEEVARFGIAPPSTETLIELLSGGNQQKVVLARTMRREPPVILLDEPTQGVDIAGREQIHRHIRSAADRGCAFLVSSTEVESLTTIADRVIVLRRGLVAAVLSGEMVTVPNVHLALFDGLRAA